MSENQSITKNNMNNIYKLETTSGVLDIIGNTETKKLVICLSDGINNVSIDIKKSEQIDTLINVLIDFETELNKVIEEEAEDILGIM